MQQRFGGEGFALPVFVALGAAVVLVGTPLAGQPTPPKGVAYTAGFRPGGERLYALDLAGTPVGEIPSGIRILRGNVEVVLKDGAPMLKASSLSEFLITLPGVLPEEFTVELDLIPKRCCPPPDFSLEGTPVINQGSASAHLLWQADGYLAVVGGAQDNFERAMPEELQAVIRGVMTRVGIRVEGKTIALYTNGQRLYTLERQFARGRVLRVSLGGVDGGENAVHLAKLRIATGGPVAVAITPGPALPIGANSEVRRGARGGADATPQTESNKNAATGTGTGPLAPVSVTAQVQAQGGVGVSWTAVLGATSYFVVRWKVDDVECCSNFSPPAGISSLTWSDAALPGAGTYGYRVYATGSSGISEGETRVTYQPPVGASPTPVPPEAGPLTHRTGASGLPAPRTIALDRLLATGNAEVFAVPPPRTIALLELTGVGPMRLNVKSGSAMLPTARSIGLTGITAVGIVTKPIISAPRTIDLPAVRATGAVRTP